MRLALALTAALLVACGGDGDSDRVLHLRTGDYTEAELRAELRAAGLPEEACQSLKGLSVEEVRDIMAINFRDEGAAKTVVQDSSPADDLRQAEIVIEECERIY